MFLWSAGALIEPFSCLQWTVCCEVSNVSLSCQGGRVAPNAFSRSHMSNYPLDFHRRAEQKWAHRAEVSTACESTPRASRVRGSQDGQPRPSQSEHRDILARSPWLRAIGVWLRAEYY